MSMNLHQSLSRAEDCSRDLESEIIEAIKLANSPQPQGPSRGDRAIVAVLNRVLADVRQVRSDLAILG